MSPVQCLVAASAAQHFTAAKQSRVELRAEHMFPSSRGVSKSNIKLFMSKLPLLAVCQLIDTEPAYYMWISMDH